MNFILPFAFRQSASMSIIAGILLFVVVADAEQFESHITAAQEFQKSGDLVRAEREILAAVKEARSHRVQTFDVATALALLGVFYQDVGRFSEAESCFLGSLRILTVISDPQNESRAA